MRVDGPAYIRIPAERRSLLGGPEIGQCNDLMRIGNGMIVTL